MEGDELDRACDEYSALRPRYTDFAGRLKGLLSDLAHTASVEPAVVEARSKDPDSLRKKLEGSQYDKLEDLTDLCGARVILFHLDDVATMAATIRSEFEIVEEVSHGDSSVENFGYKSLHLIVNLGEDRSSLPEWGLCHDLVAEIQVRTVLQHAWASISHKLDYKNEASVPQDARRKLFRVSALLETGDELFDDFRKQVEDLRASYQESSSSDSWRELPINADSLLASWSQFDWASLREVGLALGMQEPRNPDSVEFRQDAAGDLSVVAELTGLRSLGDLAEYIDLQLPERRGLLQRFVEVSTAEGWAPRSFGPQIVLFTLVLGKPHLVETLEQLGFRNEILLGAKAVAEGL